MKFKAQWRLLFLGGLISSTFLNLAVIPAVFCLKTKKSLRPWIFISQALICVENTYSYLIAVQTKLSSDRLYLAFNIGKKCHQADRMDRATSKRI